MHRTFLGVAAAVALLMLAAPGRAQAQIAGTGYDTFSFYYGYYLPHAAAIAAQPTPLDTINQNAAQRQYAAQTDRSTLYDPISPYATDSDDDPLSRYGKRGGERAAKVQGFAPGGGDGNARGTGPAMFYNRTARYFPGLKSGRGPNQNLARVRGGRGGGGGGGMPSMPSASGPR